MDSHSAPLPNPTVLRFGPDLRLTGLIAVGAALAVGLAIASGDTAGTLLFALAAGLLSAYVGVDLIFRPRIVATVEAVQLNAPTARTRLPWGQIDSIAAHTRSHLGLSSTVLEVDAGAVLAVFGRRSLGADPEDAAALLTALNPLHPPA